MTKHRKQELYIFFLLLGVTFFLWLPTLSFGFFSDDYHFLYITSLQENVWKYFLTNNVGGISGGSYGPLFNIFFTLQYKLFHLQSIGFHAVTLLIFSLTAFVIYKFSYKLSKNKSVGFVAGFLFVILQNHVEAISWVAVQPHIFASFFFLLGIYLYYHFVELEKIKLYLISLLFLGLSIFTKETAIMFPIILVLIELFFARYIGIWKGIKSLIVRMIPFGFIGILFLWLRYRVVGYLFGYYGSQYAIQETLYTRVSFKVKMFVELTINNFVSSPLRQIFTQWLGDHKVILGLAILSILALTHFAHKKYRKSLWFLLLSYLFLSIPFLSLTYNTGHNGGERYAYLLSMFAVMYLSIVLFAVTKDRKAGLFIYFSCIILFVLVSLSDVNQKLENWKVSSVIRDNIFEQFENRSFEHDEFVLFISMPDNIYGAELMRNALQEALSLETGTGYIDGERIPMYIEMNLSNYNTKLVDLIKKENGDFQLVSVVDNKRIFTGFRIFENEFGIYSLDSFNLNTHSGEGITIDFTEDLDGKGRITIAYFDGKEMQFVPINE